jgi:glycosyltransferase involved in cell wall biosynthesis
MTAKILFVTQALDEHDPVLGFTPGWVRALAAKADVAVIASEVRPLSLELGAEVVSLGKERGAPKWRRGVRYLTALTDLCRRYRPAVLVGHMCPPFVTDAAPVTKLTGTPSILWYAHPADTPTLRVAERVADLIATSLPGAYPRPGPKVRAIGQAIDTDRFRPDPGAAAGEVRREHRLELLAAGRCSPQKNYPVMIRAVGEARRRGADVSLDILGPATTDAERSHRDELVRLVSDLGLDGLVRVHDGVPPEAVAGRLAQSSALVNASRPGVSDKAVFEAMACGRAALVSSHTFSALLEGLPLELRYRDGDEADLAAAIVRLDEAPAAAIDETGAILRSRIVEHHSLDHWASAVVAMADELVSGARRGSASTAAPR